MPERPSSNIPQSPLPLAYRADIDGLRAVAVLLVLAAHFHTKAAGGYIGVDVFFVISGYLISATILRELAAGDFSLANFYERRIRRIVPALLVMLLATCVMAYRFFFPVELIDFAKSLLSAIFSVSNLYFWRQAGYFDAPSAAKPLLHTWSLAVEEQFYLVFPIFLMLIYRFAPRRLKAAIFALTSITFALAVFYVHNNASAAFFFAPLRAWELLLGTIVSQRYLPAIRGSLARNLASIAGFAMIVVPAFLHTDKTPFPGLSALAPCLGAALILAAGQTGPSLIRSMLSLRPVVQIGLISYSLYLWHWPILVFQGIGNMVAPLPANDHRLKLEMFAISLLLGWLSWRFVETPFRRGALRPGRPTLYAVNGLGVALVTAMAVAMLWSRGVPSRFPPDALEAAQYLDYDSRALFRTGSCFNGPDDSFSTFQAATCLAENPKKKNVLILGDSHAAQLWTGMSRQFPQINFLQATAFACPLLLEPDVPEAPYCRQLAVFVHDDFLMHRHVDAVLYAGRWTAADIPAIARELAWMKQHKIRVYLLGPMTEYDERFPRVLATALRDKQPQQIAQHITANPRALDGQLAELAGKTWHVPYISYFDNLRMANYPRFAAPGVPIIFDEHHFTIEGSVVFAKTVRERGQLNALE